MSISDLNEGNLLPDFEFVFSTGDQLDSLAVAGKALNAFDHKPLKDQEIMVMLYDDLSDSAPLRSNSQVYRPGKQLTDFFDKQYSSRYTAGLSP